MISQGTNHAIQDILGSYDLWFTPIHHYCYFINQFTCQKFCVITHDLPLKAFSLQPIYLVVTSNVEPWSHQDILDVECQAEDNLDRKAHHRQKEEGHDPVAHRA